LLTDNVRQFILKHGLLLPGERLLVAFSGGPDSACALLVLREIWGEVAAVYVNHQLRGEESVQEEEFVRRFCADRGIPLFCERITWARRPSNLEEEARKRRYRHLEKVAREQGYKKIALAHHQDDVVETFLLRLIRGTGPTGLAGPAIRRGRFIRPLLECSRQEILDYLSLSGNAYFQDASNLEPYQQRNRLRNELIPYIKKNFNPGFAENVLRASRWIGEQNELLDALMEPYDRLIARVGDRLHISGNEFVALPQPVQKRLLRRALTMADPAFHATSSTLERLLTAIYHQKSMELPGFLMVESTTNLIVLTRKPGAPGYCEIDVPGPGSYEFPPGKAVLCFTIETDPKNVRFTPEIACLDADTASFPLYIRNWKRGDSFTPLGMAGKKKLSDFFIDQKVPREQRKRIPLVLKDDHLLWVAGCQIDNQARITERTRTVLKIELRKENA